MTRASEEEDCFLASHGEKGINEEDKNVIILYIFFTKLEKHSC